MKKQTFFSFLFLFFFTCLFAKQIGTESARSVAISFLSENSNLRGSNLPLELVHTEMDSNSLRSKSSKSYYYVFNVGSNGGFIIVSADDVNVPIVGYAYEGNYDPNNIPDGLKSWLENVCANTEKLLLENKRATEQTEEQWSKYSSGNLILKSTSSVAPLIKTKWNQYHPYNSSIPFRIDGVSTPVTGCVATAMAQIMKFHGHPRVGMDATKPYITATHSFSVPSIDLRNFLYDWNNMSLTYTNTSTSIQNRAVGMLMFHCGVSVSMNYSYSSGAITSRVVDAMVKYFDYDHTIQYKAKPIDDYEWKVMLKNELDNNRPILYDGTNQYSGVRHAYICDGYEVRENDYFSFNWGWGGVNDGYFTLDALPYGIAQWAVVNIQPRKSNDFKLIFSDAVKTEWPFSAINRGNSFKATARLKNTGKEFYEGYWVIALTDLYNNVKTILTPNSQNTLIRINPNQEVEGKFDCSVSYNAPYGDHRLRVMYKAKNSTVWMPVNSGFSPLSIDLSVKEEPVVSSSYDLQFNMNFRIVDGYERASLGSFFKVQVGIQNMGGQMFEGYLGVALMDMNNNIKQILNNSLKTLSFLDKDVGCYNLQIPLSVMPDIYKLRVVYREKNSNTWKYIDKGYMGDFILFTVYEGNNLPTNYNFSYIGALYTKEGITSANPGKSFNVFVNIYNNGTDTFVGNYMVALVDENDNIIYILSELYTSTLTRINSHESTNTFLNCMIPYGAVPGRYRLKVMHKERDHYVWLPIAYGGKPSSDGYFIYFDILPTTRMSMDVLEENENDLLVYPNPVRDVLYIKVNDKLIKQIKLIDLYGKVVLGNAIIEKEKNISIQHLSAGIYVLYIKIEDRWLTSKIIKK